MRSLQCHIFRQFAVYRIPPGSYPCVFTYGHNQTVLVNISCCTVKHCFSLHWTELILTGISPFTQKKVLLDISEKYYTMVPAK